MNDQTQLNFFQVSTTAESQDDWTFKSANTREFSHCYHDYPARMIPQVAEKLLALYGNSATRLFDPYSGSGTSLVEANRKGINAIGTDLNPLARLIAKAKTTFFPLDLLIQEIRIFNQWALAEKNHTFKESPTVYGIPRLEFWFKPDVISALVKLREYYQNISNPDIRVFFQIAFSETVRESSNTRNEEFKLYRYANEKLERFKPNVLELMATKLERNLNGYKQYLSNFENFQPLPSAIIHNFNSVVSIPTQYVPNESIDIVITSPPYGDSGTTVAYGQYSRLSAAWLELDEPDKIDTKLMGSKSTKQISTFPSEPLNQAIYQISLTDKKRAWEVSAFYADLFASIQNVSKTIRSGGFACYVVGNRKVKGVVLPTDIAVKDFFVSCDYSFIDTFIRSIPNKRMPAQNSPSNASGVLDSTMTKEYIVVLKRK